jgi:DNA-binding transcriptional regulator LsrR (DeoR family)
MSWPRKEKTTENALVAILKESKYANGLTLAQLVDKSSVPSGRVSSCLNRMKNRNVVRREFGLWRAV